MALIGRQLTSGNYQKLDDISSQFNSSTKTFNLTTAGQPFYPGSVFSILVSVANVIQEPATSYTIDQATITFASAPTTGSTFFCIVLGTAFGVGVPADGTVTGTKLSSPFNYNSGLLYLDTANNRVGILSTSPTVTLDVVGNAKVSGTTNLNGLSVSGITTLSNTTIFNPGPVLVGTATSTGTANQKLQVSGGAYVSSGLGIGTATPSGSLDVSGGTIRVRNNGTYTEPNDNAGVLAYDSNLSEFTVSSRSSSTNSYLRFLTSNSGTSGERVRITAEGNFLVGTASSTGTASQPLQVSGGAYVSANLGVGRANPTYKIDVFGGSGLRVGGVSGDGYLLAYDSSSGNNVILEATDFSTTTKRNLTIQPNGGNVLVGAATSTGTASQPLQVTGGAYVSGNLGIGTTNPTSKLSVTGDGRFSGIVTATTFSGSLENTLTLNTSGTGLSGSATYNNSGAATFTVTSNATNANTVSTIVARDASGNFSAGTITASLTGTATSTTNIPNLTGDITSINTATTLATVNSNVGTFGSGGAIPTITVNAKGLVTGVTTTAVNPANDGTLTLAVSGTGLSGSASFTANQSGSSSFTVTSNATNANTTSAIVARDASGNFSAGTITASLTGAASLNVLKAGDTMTGQLISTTANNTATGGGQIYLNGATGNRIDFAGVGYATPATTTRSVGTKIVLDPQVTASNVDYAIGVENTAIWSSVPSSSAQFKWYAATTNIATLFGTGQLVLGTTSLTGTASQPLQVTGGAYVSGNLGIGTTNPLQKLHVLGNLLVAAGSSTGQHITQKAYELNSGTLSWEGSAGQLFSITNNLTSGSIFSVNDVSGIPSIDVNANGTVSIAAYGGNLGVGTTNPTSKLHVQGNVRITGGLFQVTGAYDGNIAAVAALNIDLSTSNFFTKTINGNSTFTVSNTPASRAFSFTLELTHTSGTITWFSGVEWPGGTAPTLTTGKTHLFMFVTDDGGTRWRGASLINYTT